MMDTKQKIYDELQNVHKKGDLFEEFNFLLRHAEYPQLSGIVRSKAYRNLAKYFLANASNAISPQTYKIPRTEPRLKQLDARIAAFLNRGYSLSGNLRQKDKKETYALSRDDENNSPALSTKLTQRSYVYSIETGLVEKKPEDVTGIKHFSEYFDSQGKKVRREDYDENGRLKSIMDYCYRNGEFDSVNFYDASLLSVRRKNPDTGIMEERTPEGELIGKLRED